MAGRARSFANAFRGLAGLVRTEPNARIHLLATVLVLLFWAWLGLDGADLALLLVCIALVWCAEALNTALESLADRVAPEPHPLVGRAKDAAAAGVLVAALLSAAVGFLILGPPLWTRLFGP